MLWPPQPGGDGTGGRAGDDILLGGQIQQQLLLYHIVCSFMLGITIFIL
jgi:hypothetical protein